MRLGVHRDQLAGALAAADLAIVYAPPDLGWDAAAAVAPLGERGRVFGRLDEIVRHAADTARPGDHLVVMSNGAFGGLHGKLLQALGEAARAQP
jgi:UDP-N-acetylmuramate: L-alanyl-gamma-D-glutamyl-meso-diaminopimelate ligase